MPYIAIGNCSKYNLYILVSLICLFMIDFLFGLNSSNKDKPVRFFSFRAKIKNHNLLYDFINFSSIFFGGVILYFLERKNQKVKKDQLSIEIYEKMKIDLLKEKKDEFIEKEKEFASEQNILFFTTSAAKNEGITELYEGLINKIKNWKDVKLVVEKQEEEEVGETEKEIEEKKEENLIVEDKKADSKKNDKKRNCPCF